MTASTYANALVTGASSGLGFETAAQLAAAGAGRIVVTARSIPKADTTVSELTARTGFNLFEPLAVDLDDLASVSTAAEHLIADGRSFDLLVLNAGISGSDGSLTGDGIEKIAAGTLTGHHLLTMRLLDAGLLAPNARIVIAGSEAARGDVPTMNPIDIDRLATEGFGGNTEAAVGAVIRMESPVKFKANDQYSTVKMFAAWWAAELATMVPEGTTVNAVSPGNTHGTNIAAKMPAIVRNVMMPIMKRIPGMAHPVSDGAARYLEAASYGPGTTGRFFASKPKKMTGPLHQIEMSHLDSPQAQHALWKVLEASTGRQSAPTSAATGEQR